MQPYLWTYCVMESPFESWKNVAFGLCKSWKAVF